MDTRLAPVSSNEFQAPGIPLGESVVGRRLYGDPRSTMMLVSGSTGSGKTAFVKFVCLMLAAVNYQLVILNPKMIGYEPLTPVATVISDPALYVKTLQGGVNEMDRRYLQMAEKGQSEYRPDLQHPRIAVVVEELAALTATAESKAQRDAVNVLITKLANMARGAGIFLLLVAQSPDSKTMDTSVRASCGIKVGMRNGREQWNMFTGGDEEAMIRSQSVIRPGEILVSTPQIAGWQQGIAYWLDDKEIFTRAKAIAMRRAVPVVPGFMDYERKPKVPLR